MLLIDLIALSVELGRRLGALDVDEKSSSIEALRELQIVSQHGHDALSVQREVRNASQHVYVELTVSALREAVRQQLQSTPPIIRSITAWVDSSTEAAAEKRQ